MNNNSEYELQTNNRYRNPQNTVESESSQFNTTKHEQQLKENLQELNKKYIEL
jgi:hypothetical protein